MHRPARGLARAPKATAAAEFVQLVHRVVTWLSWSRAGRWPDRSRTRPRTTARPALPAAVSLSALLSGCAADGEDGANGKDAIQSITSARFIGMAAPTLANPASLRKASSDGARLEPKFADGSTQAIDLGYTPFFVTGDTVPKTGGGTIVAGGYLKLDGTPLLVSGTQAYSDCVDGSSLFTMLGAPANTVFAVVQFKYQSAAYGAYPSPICVLTLNQDAATGALTLKTRLCWSPARRPTRKRRWAAVA